MKLSLFGVGDAGTRLVDSLLQAELETGRNFTDGNVLAFNTAAEVFGEATTIPEERQILIGDTHPAVNQYVDPTDDSDGDDTADTDVAPGVDGDPELGATVANDELPEIRRALDLVDDTEVDAAMVVTGFGGGTGAGVGSVLLEELKAIYEIPVYVLGALPATSEADERALTAARAIRTFVPLADSVIPVDNEAWHRNNDPLAEQYDRINGAVATRVLSLFATGETDRGTVSEMRIDPADAMRTLAVGGLSAIGYSTIQVDSNDDGFFTRLLRLLGLADDTPDTKTDAATIKRLVRSALESKLSLPCDIESTERVLLILSGPPAEISRKGFETGRYLLEQETGTVEVLAGDEPLTNAGQITATVLFSNVTAIPRVAEIQQRAMRYQRDHDADMQITTTATRLDGATELALDSTDDPDEETQFEFQDDPDDRSERTAGGGGDTATDESDDSETSSATDHAANGDDATAADGDTPAVGDDSRETEATTAAEESE